MVFSRFILKIFLLRRIVYDSSFRLSAGNEAQNSKQMAQHLMHVYFLIVKNDSIRSDERKNLSNWTIVGIVRSGNSTMFCGVLMVVSWCVVVKSNGSWETITNWCVCVCVCESVGVLCSQLIVIANYVVCGWVYEFLQSMLYYK